MCTLNKLRLWGPYCPYTELTAGPPICTLTVIADSSRSRISLSLTPPCPGSEPSLPRLRLTPPSLDHPTLTLTAVSRLIHFATPI